MFQMMGVFAEFERAMIRERVNAGLKRARAQGRIGGRPRIAPDIEERIRAALDEPDRAGGVRGLAARFGVAVNTVQRIARPFGPGQAASAVANAACDGESELAFAAIASAPS